MTELRAPECTQCGGPMVFDPSTQGLKCSQCKAKAALAPLAVTVGELPYDQWVSQVPAGEASLETLSMTCGSCGGVTNLPPAVTAGKCPFCRAPFVAEAVSTRIIRPQGVIPFQLDQDAASEVFKKWVGKRWLAPRELATSASGAKLTGIYVPWWTYDARTTTDYTGRRGMNRQETRTRQVTDADGTSRTETYTETVIDWYPASGRVEVPFDDLLVFAGGGLPEKHAASLEPWPWDLVAPFRDDFVLGFLAESYRTDLGSGFEAAKAQMDGPIVSACKRDIGGDHQDVNDKTVHYHDVTFKHLLLPVWLNVYQHKGKTFQVLVNGATGEVRGQRPFSPVKVVALVAALILVVVLIVLLARG